MTEDRTGKGGGNPPDEQQLDEYLRGESELSGTYRELPDSEPPAHLDAAIRAEAARAARPRPLQRWTRWTLPLAATATVLLAANLALLMRDQPEFELMVTDAPREVAGVRVMEDALVLPEARRATSPKATVDEDLRFARLMDEELRRGDASRPELAASFARQEQTDRYYDPGSRPMAADSVGEETSFAGDERLAVSEQRQRDVGSMAGSLAESPRFDSEGLLRAERLAPEKEVLVDESAEIAAATKKQERVVQEAPLSVAAGAAQPSAPRAGESDQQDSISTEGESPTAPSPDIWLAGIRALYERGEAERAIVEFRRFREVYPDYPQQK